MGTKVEPGQFDCYVNAKPDEPMFVLLARDPYAPLAIMFWARSVEDAITLGYKPESDLPKVLEAKLCAQQMINWRTANWPMRREEPVPTKFLNFEEGYRDLISVHAVLERKASAMYDALKDLESCVSRFFRDGERHGFRLPVDSEFGRAALAARNALGMQVKDGEVSAIDGGLMHGLKDRALGLSQPVDVTMTVTTGPLVEMSPQAASVEATAAQLHNAFRELGTSNKIDVLVKWNGERGPDRSKMTLKIDGEFSLFDLARALADAAP